MQDSVVTVLLPLGLFAIMFGMGVTLRPADFGRVLRYPKAVAIGLAAQLVLLPLVCWWLVTLFETPPLLAVGLMCAALCSGGITSNMFSLLARGDVALSITLTAVSGLITPFTLPFVLQAVLVAKLGSTQAVQLPLGETIGLLVFLTLLPVGLGMIVGPRFPGATGAIVRSIRGLSIVMVGGLTILAIQQTWHQIGTLMASLGPVVLALNIGCMAIGVGLARALQSSKRQAATIGIEIGIQNDTVALLVTNVILQNATMFLAPATYALVSMVNGCVFAWLVRSWLEHEPADAALRSTAQPAS